MKTRDKEEVVNSIMVRFGSEVARAWDDGYRQGEKDALKRVSDRDDEYIRVEKEKAWNEGYAVAAREILRKNEEKGSCGYCMFLNANESDPDLPCKTCCHYYTNRFKLQAGTITNYDKLKEVFPDATLSIINGNWLNEPYKEPEHE